VVGEGSEELLVSVRELAHSLGQTSLRAVGRQAEADRAVPPSLSEAFAQTGLDLTADPEPDGAGLGVGGLYAVGRELAEGDPSLAAALLLPAWLRHLSRAVNRPLTALSLDPAALDGQSDQPVVALLAQGEGSTLFLAPEAMALAESAPERPGESVGLSAAGLVRSDRPQASAVTAGGDAKRLWREGVLLAISLMLGAGRAALNTAVTYALTRKTFGQALTTYQGVAFPLADAATWLEAAEGLTERAIWLHQSGDASAQQAMLCALVASRQAAFKAGDEAVQTLGGAGFVSEFPVEMWFRDAVAAGALTGRLDRFTVLLGEEVAS
jgi:alkylation response protein AidB-like acyl-CoA dehydrogenase